MLCTYMSQQIWGARFQLGAAGDLFHFCLYVLDVVESPVGSADQDVNERSESLFLRLLNFVYISTAGMLFELRTSL